MELIYTTRDTGFEPGKNYRNPRYFDRIEQASSVVLDGDFPEVRKAYEAAGVSVTGPVTEDEPAPRRARKARVAE